MKKKLITAILILAMILTVAQGIGLASSAEGDWVVTGQPVNVAFQSTQLNYMTLNGTTRGFRYTYFWFRNKDGIREEHPVYCLAPDARGAFELVRDDGTTGDAPNTAKYITGERVTRADYIKVMEAGYPHNTAASLGLSSPSEGYYATKIALWMVILGITPDSGRVGKNLSHPDQAAAQRVYDAAMQIYTSAQANMWAGVNESRVEITAPTAAGNWKLSADGQWYELSVTVRTNKHIGNDPNESGEVQLSWDNNTATVPGGFVVLNGNDDITATMKPLLRNRKYEGTQRIQPITIRIPAQTVIDYFEANEESTVYPIPKLIALAEDMVALNFYVATYSGGGGQPYLIEGNRKADLSSAFQTAIPKPPRLEDKPYDTGLRVIKLQSGTLIPLPGAVFEIYDPRGQLIGSFTTDANGEINISVGEEGTYSIKETIPPQYHILPKHTTQNVRIDAGGVTTATVTNDPYGSLRIEKRDAANGRLLGGASIQIRHISSGASYGATTDASGIAEFRNLPIGGYEIRELVSPYGYALDTATHTVAVQPQTQGTTTYTLANRANPGLRIVKLDGATSTPIEGATFEIYRDGTFVGEYRTNHAGEILLTNMSAGTYTAKEKSTVEPYAIDPTAQWVQLTVGQERISELIFLNTRKPGIHLIKLDADTMRPLANATYAIRKIGGSFAQEYATDANGEVSLGTLDPGAYAIEEVRAPAGYLIDDAIRTVQINAGENARFVFTDTKKPSLELVKHDPTGNENLGGATFRISKIADGSRYLDRTTDSNGRIRIDDLDPGVYSMKEISAPSGYLLDETEHHVELFPGRTSQIVVANVKKPSIIIWKNDGLTAKPLPNTEFSIAKMGGAIIYEGLTNGDGFIRLDGLDEGWYAVTELAPPPGYLPSPISTKNVHLYGGAIVEVKFDNLKCPKLTVCKVDRDTLEPLPGVRFGVWHSPAMNFSGGVIDLGEHVTDASGRIILDGNMQSGWYRVTELAPPLGYLANAPAFRDIFLAGGDDKTLVFENSKKPTLVIRKHDAQTAKTLPNAEFSIRKKDGPVIYEGVTDANGSITLTDLDPGYYTITEIAPPPGYLLASPVSRDAYLKPGQTLEVKLDDLKCPTLTITKLDSATRNPIGNVRFGVKHSPSADFNGGVIDLGEYMTDASGRIVLDDSLQSGWYRVTEIAPPPGYVLGEPASKDVSLAGGESKTLVFENTRKPALIVRKYDLQTAATLKNAKFSIRRKDGAVIYEGLTDAEGKISLADLDPGYYTITEIAPPPGYLLATPDTRDVLLQPGQVLEAKFDNLRCPTLTISKLDSITHDPIKNVRFNVKFSPDINYTGGVIDMGNYATDENGKILLDGSLQPGWYRVTEIEPAQGYTIREPATQDIFLKGGEDKALTFENIPKSAIVIRKTDLGGHPLQGATFEIKYLAGTSGSGGTIIKTATTSANGTITVTGLTPGTYIVEETIPAPGHQLSNPSAQTALIDDSEQCVVDLAFANPAMGRLVIEKRSSAASHLPIAGVTFKVTDSSGAAIGPDNGLYLTDAAGQIAIDEWLPIGSTAIVTEVSCPEGYNLDAPPQTVKIKEGTTHTLTFYDSPKSGLQIIKVEAGTKKPLKDAHFRVVKASGEAVGDYATDAEGLIIVPNLAPGWYKAYETKAPAGYLRDDTPKDFEITGNQFVRLEFEDRPLSGLTIMKYDSTEKSRALAGAVFSVTDSAGRHVGNANGRFTTDRHGMILVGALPPGTYVAAEVSPPPGYKLDATPQTIAIEAGKGLYTLSFYDEPYGRLEILKIDEDTRQPIPNAEFAISRMNGERLSANTYVTDAQGLIRVYGLDDGWYTIVETRPAKGYLPDPTPRSVEVKNGAASPLRITNRRAASLTIEKTDSITGRGIGGVTFVLYDSGKNPVMQLTTDQSGIASTDAGLAGGKYFLRELEAAEGYVPDNEWKTIYVEAGKTARIGWQNTPMLAQIQITKYSADHNSVTGAPAGSPLSGAVFEITRARSGAVVGYIATDARGVAASEPLPLGRYHVRETAAPQYYLLSGERMEANLEYPGQIARLAAYDRSVALGTEIKKVGNVEIIAGDSMRYDMSVRNASNAPLSEFYWSDRLPTDAARAQSLTTGTYSQRLYYRILYKTNASDWRILASNLLSTNNYSYSLSAAALGLASGEAVTSVRFEFGTVAAGFASVAKPTITVQTLATLASGYQIVNRAEVGGKYGAAAQISTTAWGTKVVRFGDSPALPKTGH